MARRDPRLTTPIGMKVEAALLGIAVLVAAAQFVVGTADWISRWR